MLSPLTQNEIVLSQRTITQELNSMAEVEKLQEKSEKMSMYNAHLP
jgi:hypothetical protein